MAEKREVYEQVVDDSGRTRLDRPFTPEEAQAQDARNREKLGGRTGRFDPYFTGEEEQVRAKRGTRKS